MTGDRKNRLFKKIAAVVVAGFTAFASTGLQPVAFAGSTITDETDQNPSDTLTDGSTISETFTSIANGNNSSTLDSFSIKLMVPAGQSVTLIPVIYQDLPNMETPFLEDHERTDLDDAFSPATVDNPNTSKAVTKKVTFQNDSSQKMYLAAGEIYSINIQVYGSDVRYFQTSESNAVSFIGDGEVINNVSVMEKSETNRAGLPSDVESIDFSDGQNGDIFMKKGESLDITAAAEPAGRKREVILSSDNESVAAYSDGKLTAGAVGTATLTASYGQKSATRKIYVYEASLTENEFTYDGKEKKPPVNITAGNTELTQGTDYNVSYQNNINAGTGTAVVTGVGDKSGLSASLDFTINKASIELGSLSGDKPSDSISVNSSNDKATVNGFSVNGRKLTQDTDFIAKTVRKSVSSSKITYTVTLNGIGNYEGTKIYEVEQAYSSDNKTDISNILTVSAGSFPYTGNEVKPTLSDLTIKYKGTDTALTPDDTSKILNNTLSYSDNTSVGTGTVTLTGNGDNGFTGSIKVPFKIKANDIVANYGDTDTDGNIKITANGKNLSVTDKGDGIGKANSSAVYVNDGGIKNLKLSLKVRSNGDDGPVYRDLTEDTDYTVSYSDNNEIGTATAIVTGIKNFTGTWKIKYKIVGDFNKDLTIRLLDENLTPENGTFTSAYSAVYTGSRITLTGENEPRLIINGDILQAGYDYDLEYSNNTDAGTATAKIVGKGDYKDQSVKLTYKITPKSMDGFSSSVSKRFTYTGSSIRPDILVKDENGKILSQNMDYTVSFSDNTNAGTAKYTINGKGNYSGRLSGTFTIGKADINAPDSGYSIKAADSVPYSGKDTKVDAELIFSKGKDSVTVNPAEYKVTYSNNSKVGTAATVTIEGRGKNLSGRLSKHFTIVKNSLKSVTVTLGGGTCTAPKETDTANTYKSESSYSTIYNGTTANPKVVLKDGGRTLTPITDYVVNYINASNVTDKATVRITGRNNYSGVLLVSFKIIPRDIYNVKAEALINGSDSKPSVTVTDTPSVQEVTLKEGSDFETVPGDDKDEKDWPKTPGKHKVIIKGLGNYSGTKTISYKIGKDIADDAVLSLVNPGDSTVEYQLSNNVYQVPYIGANKPKVILKENDGTVSSDNYTVSYSLVTDSKASESEMEKTGALVEITVKASKDNQIWFGSRTVRYKVNPLSLASIPIAETPDVGKIVAENNDKDDSRISGKGFEYYYNGSAKNPDIALRYYPVSTDKKKSILLKKGSDYTVSGKVEADVRSNPYPLTITAADGGALIGTGYLGVVVKPLSLGMADVTLNTEKKARSHTDYQHDDGTELYTSPASFGSAVDYTGSPVTFSDVSLSAFNGKCKIPASGMILSYADNTAPGKASLTITPNSTNYTGKLVVEYKINNRIFTDSSVAKIENIKYDGEEHTPDPAVKFNNEKLKKGTDYTLSIQDSNGKEVTPLLPGDYKAVIKGIGVCKGSGPITRDFKITGDISDSSLFTVNASDVIKSGQARYKMTMSGGHPASEELYDGVKTISVTRKAAGTYSDTALVKGTDYDVKYTLPSKPGKIKVNVQGKGAYTGTASYDVTLTGDLSDTTVTGDGDDYAYTGSQVSPKLFVQYNGVSLDEGKDYVIEYNSEMTIVGQKNFTIKPAEGSALTGRKTGSLYVKYDLSTAKITPTDDRTYYYNGEQHKPSVKVKSVDKELTEGVDYFISYGENVSGTGTVKISSADGRKKSANSFGENTYSFKISPVKLFGNDHPTDVEFEGGVKTISPKTYTGTTITPQVESVRDTLTGVTLNPSTDYHVIYGANTDTGKGTVTIEGTGNYTGKKTFEFNIKGKELDNSDKTANDVTVNIKSNAKYEGIGSEGTVEPEYDVVYNGMTLEKDKDYKTTISSSEADGKITGRLTIIALAGSNYSGKTSVAFDVDDRSLNDSDITSSDNKIAYTGSVIPESKIMKGIKVYVRWSDGTRHELVQGKEYTVSLDGSGQVKDAGTYTFNIAAVSGSHFKDRRQISVEVVPKEISDPGVSVDDIENQKYNGGKAVTPSVTVRDTSNSDRKSGLLIEGKDYSLEYVNNTAAASADSDNAPRVIIKGEGNYSGSLEKTFSIGKELTKANTVIKTDPSVIYYDGEEHKPDVTATVRDGSGTVELTASGDGDSPLLVEYPEDTVHAGSKTVKVTGTNGYYGTVTGTYRIRPKKAENIRVVPDLPQDEESGDYYTTYNGGSSKPGVKVYDDDISDTVPLSADGENASYEIAGYERNNSVTSEKSPAVIIVRMKGDYSSTSETEKTALFQIRPKEITDYNMALGRDNAGKVRAPRAADDESGEGVFYKWQKGDLIEPDIAFSSGDREVLMRRGTDYKVTYKSDVSTEDGVKNAGAARAYITGTGNYQGTFELPYIVYADLKDADVKVPTQFYAGEDTSPNPEITVECGGNILSEKKDDGAGDYYRTETSDTHFEKDGKIIITSANEYYTGSKTVKYQISADGKYLTCETQGKSYTYSGKPMGTDMVIKTPNNTVLYDGTHPENYKDVTVKYKSVDADGNVRNGDEATVHAGTVTATISNMSYGSLTGLEKTITYTIGQKDISDSDVTDRSAEFRTYSGKSEMMKPEIFYNGMALKEIADYKASYTDDYTGKAVDPTEPGSYTITVNGTGNYKGKRTDSYKIIPGRVRLLKVLSVSDNSADLKWNYTSGATGYQICDAIGGKVYGITTSNYFSVGGLKSGSDYTFRVRAYRNRDGKAVFGNWMSVKATTKIGKPKQGEISHDNNADATLKWSTSANVDGYAVYRSKDAYGKYELAATLPLGAGEFTDKGVANGSRLYYRVRGFKIMSDGSVSYGEYSSPIEVTAKSN